MATKLYSDDTIIDAKLDKSDLLDGNLVNSTSFNICVCITFDQITLLCFRD